ncbi:MAG: winged helix-turn-helix domain-containing protein [Anaerolineales bacterium]|jgi:DNA-binding transcriptional ArsR family regulator
MSKEPDTLEQTRVLQFACDCVSYVHDQVRDPWSYVTRAGLISSETREIILNKTYRHPKTVTQLAREIGLSQPVIYKHVKEMLASEMIREVPIPSSEKAYRVEKYYGPNFPVLLEEDQAEIDPVCRQVAKQVAQVFMQHRDELIGALLRSSLGSRGHIFEQVPYYLYSKIRRMARDILNERGFFPEIPVHGDGSRWLYWAEEIRLGEQPAEETRSPQPS